MIMLVEREALERVIEALINLLDMIDGDPDLEDGTDAECETWSHPDDHPAELFIGRRQ